MDPILKILLLVILALLLQPNIFTVRSQLIDPLHYIIMILSHSQSEGWSSYLSDRPETFQNVSLTVRGDVPAWLQGIFVSMDWHSGLFVKICVNS